MALQFIRENSNEFTITAFDVRSVRIGEKTFNESVVVSHSASPRAWEASLPLTAEHVAVGTMIDAEIVIIGTGEKHVFPKPDVLRALMEARIGFEVMHSAAACRTYNVLLAEGRKVGLLLIIEQENQLFR
jgi:uncharacterized protein